MANKFSFPPVPPPPSHQQQQQHSTYNRDATSFQHSPGHHQPLEGHINSQGRAHHPDGRHTGTQSYRGYNSHQRQSFQSQHDARLAIEQGSPQQLATNHGNHPRSRFESHSRHAGSKRKLDAYRERHDINNRPGAETAPSVPSFGATLLKTPVSRSDHKDAIQPSQQSRPSLFGLNQSTTSHHDNSDTNSDHDDDEQDDVDEEATYAQLGTKLVFEYEGTVVKLDSEADLAKWHAERKRKWPSNARIAEKQAQRQETGAERIRLLEAAYGLREPGFKFRLPRQWRTQTLEGTDVRSAKPESEVNAQDTSVASAGLPGMSMYESDDQSDDQNEAARTHDTKAVSAMHDREGDAGDNDDGDAPEQVSSKAPSNPSSSSADQRACKYFFYYGKCKEGDNCSYRHDARSDQPLVHIPATQKRGPTARAKKSKQEQGRKGIHQLLVEQENEAADRLALQVIKYLGGIGFFKER